MNMNDYRKSPIIGPDIPWEAIRREFCRVKHFTPFGNVESGKVKKPQSFLPYASLLVDLPKLPNANLPQVASMPVVQRDDFLRLWEIFHERGVSQEEEVLVTYEPFFRSHILSRFMPRLHIFIYKKGHFDQENDSSFQADNAGEWLREIERYTPKNYKSHR
jgi:hypothetical protein